MLNYVLNHFEPESYWAGTSGNNIVPTMLKSIRWDTVKKVRGLLAGEPVRTTLSQSITYSGRMGRTSYDFFSVMAMAGYLNAVRTAECKKGEYTISIPNKEMMQVFLDDVYRGIEGMEESSYMEFVDAAASSDTSKMREVLLNVLESIGGMLLPNPDIDVEERDSRFRESNYNLLILSIVNVARHLYEIDADMEHGNGRSDVFMKNRDPSGESIIMELKWKGSPKTDLDDLAESAIWQIHEKDYYLNLKGDAILYGIAFRKRDVCIHTEMHRA